MPKHIDKFYTLLGSPAGQFQQKIDNEFIQLLAKWQIMGGAAVTERKKSIQEAVDALAVYKAMGFPDAAVKKAAFTTAYAKHIKGAVPPASADVLLLTQEMKQTEAQYNILLAKFMLLDYWEGVAKGVREPEYPPDGGHWALHEFLNFEPQKVRPILELMLDDAKSVLSKPYSMSLEKWYGVDAGKSVSFTKDSMSAAIKAEAFAKAGAEVKGEFELEYKGFKMQASAELFAGARAQASGAATVLPTSVAAKASVEVEVGIRLKGNLNIDILDVLELEAGLDALVGALANAEVEFELGLTGVKLAAKAEAFAGARITGEAKSTLKIGGRDILSGKATGSLSAGVGASAEANIQCDIFGKVGFGAKAGVTLGLGAEAGAELTVDFHNVRWGAANLFWAYLNEQGWKNKGKVWFLPVEENVQMCGKARDALFTMLGDVYRKHEDALAKLNAWNQLDSRVAQSVRQHNPRLAALMSA
jgi:hypothetical protein